MTTSREPTEAELDAVDGGFVSVEHDILVGNGQHARSGRPLKRRSVRSLLSDARRLRRSRRKTVQRATSARGRPLTA
jgi:hypothetical protein